MSLRGPATSTSTLTFWARQDHHLRQHDQPKPDGGDHGCPENMAKVVILNQWGRAEENRGALKYS
jgi:hypothetical protein